MIKSVVFAFEARGVDLEFRAWQGTPSLASRFEVLASTIVRSSICYDVTSCRLVEIYRPFVGTYVIHAQKYTNYRGTSFLENVGTFIPEY